MSTDVGIVDNVKTNTPQTVSEIVELVEQLQRIEDEVTVTLSGYSVEVVQEIAERYQTNFFNWDETQKIDLNPYTIIYIDKNARIRSSKIDCKSKLIIYGTRPVSNHQ
jgi:hypothetical protein